MAASLKGMYVDDAHCLHMLSVSGEREWYVYSASETDEGYEATLRAEEDSLKLDKNSETIAGSVNGKREIEWSDEQVWYPIHMTGPQVHLLTRRPYVPITLLFFLCIQHVASTTTKWIRGILPVEKKA